MVLIVLGICAHAADTPIQSVLSSYQKIQQALANDSTTGIADAASQIVQTAKADGGKTVPAEVGKDADAVAKAKDLDGARAAFKTLSDDLIKALEKQNPKTGQYYGAYCPMAGASWIQKGKDISNPYYGKSMSSCGDIKQSY